jgi:hypothetical protein
MKQLTLIENFLDYSSALKMETMCSPQTSVDFNGLHGILSQKIDLSITTTVRTSNPMEPT